MHGVELSADAILASGVLRAKATYTYDDAENLDFANRANDADAGLQLYRVPRNSGSLSLIYDGIAKLELVGERLDSASGNVTLAPYAKLDLLANYKVNDNLAAFARIENLTDVRYEEVYNYGTAGRSYYAGISYSW